MNYFRKGSLAAAFLAATSLSSVPAHAEISDGVIRIGVMNDQSGPYADNCGQGSVVSVKMAVENHGGAINGVPIEVVVADDQNKPDIGAAQALKWVENEGVDAIVGCSASSIALAVSDIMATHKKPYLIAGTATTETTNSKCTAYNTNWAYNTYTLAKGSVMSQLAQGLDEWYFITVDYTFGKAWQEDATKFIEANGGKVLGSVLHPLGANDFSSQLLQAQASGAKVIGIANAGSDLANVLKQAKEFGIAEAGQKLAPLGMQVNNVDGIGLETMQGLIAAAPAYWDQSPETRAFSEKWSEAMNGRKPNESQTVTYSAVDHYLKAIEAAGSDAGDDVMSNMREMPVDDLFTKASIREDGVVFRDMLQVQVKTPAESTGDWDYYKIIGKLDAKDVWPPLEESACPLVKK
ncbi:ABC transporter substrate-binding protein [Rhizobium sp. L1K21]|uniref:ABC transporter substrate-binding protein n=1 Tax=Rhizobium sp. L1K21 TaxID=2954933 RepID=UPI0020924BBA|nr:ABC transporter substrate-binding protein [Rhizobium sp. L1K21]MCO6188474.1 ABC transporter substrate-binding protein [Rhizobium sp. L1K21]